MTHVAPPPPGLETRAAMRRALAAGRIGTWHWDIASDAVLWDGALCVIYGLSPAEAPKTAPDFLGLVIPEDRDATVRAVSHALEGAASVEHRFRASVGERTFWIHDRAHVIRDRDARPTSVIGMCCDIASDPNAGIVPFPGSLGDRRPVDLAVYLGTMVESLRQIGGTGRLDYEAIPAPCRFDRAVKLGLILMELAAPVGMAAETRPDRRLRVTLKSGARSARLEVADSEGHVIDDIGIESATALTRQIDGTLASDDAPGLGRQWRVDFPLPDVTA